MHVDGYTVKRIARKTKPLEMVNYIIDMIRYDQSLNTKSNYCIEFNSLSDLVNCVDHNSLEHGNKSYTNKSHHFSPDRAYSKWVFGSEYTTYKKSFDHLRLGMCSERTLKLYDKERDAILDRFPEINQLQDMALKLKKKKYYSFEGGELDIDKYMAGDPEHWQSIKHIKEKKTMKLIFDCGMSAANKPDLLVENIVLLVILAEVIEMAGVSVEVWFATMGDGTTSLSLSTITTFKMKGADQRIDVQSMLACGIPALLRFFIFRVWTNLMPGEPSNGLGSPLSDCPDWFMQMYEYDLYVKGGGLSDDSVERLINKLKDIIKDL